MIVEEALRDQKAHWYSYIRTIQEAALKRGWEVNVACNKNADEFVKRTFTSFPLFSHAVYLDNTRPKFRGERYYSFLLHSFRSLKVLWPFLKRRPLYDEVFVPTVLVQHLLAWLILLLFHPNKPKRVTLFFVTNPGVWNRDILTAEIPKTAILLKCILFLFRALPTKKRVRFAVETKAAKSEFERLSNLEFELLPHPVQFDLSSNPETGKGTSLVFACFGFARYEKGTDLLKRAIETLLTSQKDPELRFVIQWTDPFSMPDGSFCLPDGIIANHSQVRIISNALNNDEYLSLLRGTDCMILPYRNSSYYGRVSRVAIEATCFGIPLIYTKCGWLEELVTNFGAGIGIEDESLNDLLNGIRAISSKYLEFRNLASERSNSAKNYFSPDYFIELLLN